MSFARPQLALFLGALAIRWAYALTLFSFMGESGIMGVDSYTYGPVGEEFAAALAAGSVQGWDWLGVHPVMMPFYTWFVALHALLGTGLYPFNYVLTQGLLDAGTCVLIYRMAQTLDERYAAPAGILSALNPTQIVLSGLIYPDTPFVFFVALSFYGVLRWMRSFAWSDAWIVAAGLGFATGCRVLIVPWAGVLIVFLAGCALIARRLSVRAIQQLVVIAMIVAIPAGMIGFRNLGQYGGWSLTSQGGVHLARWVVPLVKEAKDGTPWQQTYEEMERRTRERFGPLPKNHLEQSRQYMEIGREAMNDLGWLAIAKSWTMGAAINLGAPGVVLSPPLLQIPRTGFYATPGQSYFEKIWNFLFHSESAIYAWALLLGLGGVGVLRLIQIAGLVALLREGHKAPLVLFVLWCGFILAVNGPIASPKYRLPLEPILLVIAGAGLGSMSKRWKRSGHPRALPAT